ncbi:MAG: sugar transferase [Geobacter sp.]|nr:MAG: sugar transferase [Geobacter sp.]
MFTGIAESAVAQAVQTVEQKVRESLAARLPQAACQRIGVSTVTFPEKEDGKLTGAHFNPVFYPEIFHKEETNHIPETIKRAMDIFGSVLALLFLSPVFAAIAALIRLTSPGPILFKQERIGQFGKPFTFLKFRSMYTNNDDSIHRHYVRDLIANKVDCESKAEGEAVFKIRNDPRVTPLGAFLRKTSLDELPQFFNVLKGEMSLVGPRPPVPYEVKDYGLWHRYRILAGKPGITGLWQVRGRSRTTFDGMVRLDIQYIRTWSLWLDLKLLLATPMAVVRGKGAY